MPNPELRNSRKSKFFIFKKKSKAERIKNRYKKIAKRSNESAMKEQARFGGSSAPL